MYHGIVIYSLSFQKNGCRSMWLRLEIHIFMSGTSIAKYHTMESLFSCADTDVNGFRLFHMSARDDFGMILSAKLYIRQ